MCPFFILLSSCVSPPGPDTILAKPATMQVPHTDVAPVIDGRLDDAVWKRTDGIRLGYGFGPTPGAPGRPTRAWLCWDRDALYVAFRATDPDIWSTLTERDGPLWEGEVVEIYIDPDGDGKNYKEFEVSPLNTVIDLNIARGAPSAPNWREARKWDAPGWRTAVGVKGTLAVRTDTDECWVVEMLIPWQVFTTAGGRPPGPGDRWRAQLLRIERPKAGKPEFSAWSATDTFHRTERFGTIVFVRGRGG